MPDVSKRGSIPDNYRYRGVEYGTERPCEIARIKGDDGTVTLAYRYTDEECAWFPAWTGPIERAVKVPRGWLFSDEWLALIEALPYIERFDQCQHEKHGGGGANQ